MKNIKDSDFQKSSFSGYGSNTGTCCVLVARKNGLVAVRDGKDATKGTLLFSEEEWQAFISGVKNDEFEIE